MSVYTSSPSLFSSAPMAFRKAHFVLVTPDGMREFPLLVEVAATDAERARGLMFRTHLDPDAGMLFSFEQPQILSFWMKNTLIPLDIIFLDEHRRFVSATTMTPCTSDPCMTYPSGGPAMYALEVEAGFIQQHGVGPGSRLEYVSQ